MRKRQEVKEIEEANEKHSGELREAPLPVLFERVRNRKKRKGFERNLGARRVRRARKLQKVGRLERPKVGTLGDRRRGCRT